MGMSLHHCMHCMFHVALYDCVNYIHGDVYIELMCVV